MNSYREILRYLYGLQHRGMKFGLRNTRALLAAIGNPERRFPSIHIAGTNGKGSTAAFLASIGTESGYRTGLYTSPHLIRFTERIRIDGREIPERRLVEYVRTLRASIETVDATFFEATTCIAFKYFADEGVDLAIIETGLGGRLDSTNVLTPLVSVITSIALDHTNILGKTVRSIAREKGGIIKAGIPCVTGCGDAETVRMLRVIAKRQRTRLVRTQQRIKVRRHHGAGSETVEFRGKHVHIRRTLLGLLGEHQSWNARTSIATLDVLKDDPEGAHRFRRITNRTISRGLTRVVRNTGLRARLETSGRNRRYIMDVAHNPEAVGTLVAELVRRKESGLIVVFGVMKDKDYPSMVREISRVASWMVAVAPASDRALRVKKLFSTANQAGIRSVLGGSVRRGLGIAEKLAGRGAHILVTGSHYVVGEALEALKRSRQIRLKA